MRTAAFCRLGVFVSAFATSPPAIVYLACATLVRNRKALTRREFRMKAPV